MNDKEHLINFCDKLIDTNKKKMQYAENIGKLEKEIYFYEGSISAIEVIKGELAR